VYRYACETSQKSEPDFWSRFIGFWCVCHGLNVGRQCTRRDRFSGELPVDRSVGRLDSISNLIQFFTTESRNTSERRADGGGPSWDLADAPGTDREQSSSDRWTDYSHRMATKFMMKTTALHWCVSLVIIFLSSAQLNTVLSLPFYFVKTWQWYVKTVYRRHRHIIIIIIIINSIIIIICCLT